MQNVVSRIDNNYKILNFKGTRNDFASCEANRAATPCVAKPMPLRTKSMPSEPAIALRSTSFGVNDDATSESRRVLARIIMPWSREAVV